MNVPDFFKYKPGFSTSYFGTGHILFIIFGILGSLFLCFALRKLKKETSLKILKVISIVALTFDPLYWLWEFIVTGTFSIETSLPLYFCSLFYLVMPFAFFAKNRIIKESALSYLATMNLIAGLMGLVFNTNLVAYPLFSFVGIRTMLYHILMVFVSCFIWTSRCYTPKISHTMLFFIPVTIMFVPALIVNYIFKADYCFLGGGAGTPFEILSRAVPIPVYVLIFYFTIYLVINLVFYIPTICKFAMERKTRKKINL